MRGIAGAEPDRLIVAERCPVEWRHLGERIGAANRSCRKEIALRVSDLSYTLG